MNKLISHPIVFVYWISGARSIPLAILEGSVVTVNPRTIARGDYHFFTLKGTIILRGGGGGGGEGRSSRGLIMSKFAFCCNY